MSTSSNFLPETVLIHLHSSKENFYDLVGGYLDRLIYPFTSLMSIGASVSPHAVHFHRVPSLGGYNNDLYATNVRLIGCFSGMVFGMIHCLGWNYLFQIPTEHTLWHAASLAIAGAPALLVLYVEYWIGWRSSHVGRLSYPIHSRFSSEVPDVRSDPQIHTRSVPDPSQ
jgi:hypothetical protein